MVASDWAWLSVVLVCGCSSTTNITNANCGPGTVLKDGVCVAADVDAGDDSVVVDSSAPEDAAVESGSDALVDTSTADGETGPVTHPDDDPCPTGLKFPLTPEYELRNCSDTCGVKKPPECATSCLLPSTKVFTFDASPDRAWVRTPSRPGLSKMCKEPCGSSGIAASVQVQGDWAASGVSAVLQVKVSPPWYITGTPLQPAASCTRAAAGCYRFAQREPVSVYTTDPDAPARNIEITVVKGAKSGPCP